MTGANVRRRVGTEDNLHVTDLEWSRGMR